MLTKASSRQQLEEQGGLRQGNKAACNMCGRTYLIARLDDAGQFGGLLDSLGVAACEALVVLGTAVICARVLVKIWAGKKKRGHQ